MFVYLLNECLYVESANDWINQVVPSSNIHSLRILPGLLSRQTGMEQSVRGSHVSCDSGFPSELPMSCRNSSNEMFSSSETNHLLTVNHRWFFFLTKCNGTKESQAADQGHTPPAWLQNGTVSRSLSLDNQEPSSFPWPTPHPQGFFSHFSLFL